MADLLRAKQPRNSGSVYLAGARITWHGPPALDATNAVIGGGLNGGRMIGDGKTRLHRTRIAASIQLPGARRLQNAHGSTLEAEALAVTAGCGAIAASRPSAKCGPAAL